jgi:hypothetical protein
MNNVEVCIDPLNAFPVLTHNAIVKRNSIYLEWADAANEIDPREIREGMEAFYRFPCRPIKGVSLDIETGLHSYPGDPDLSPLIKLGFEFTTVYIYEYSIIAFVDNENGAYVLVRMD